MCILLTVCITNSVTYGVHMLDIKTTNKYLLIIWVNY